MRDEAKFACFDRAKGCADLGFDLVVGTKGPDAEGAGAEDVGGGGFSGDRKIVDGGSRTMGRGS